MEKFNAIIKKVDGKDASYIEIPFNVEEVFGSKRVKVKATFDKVEYRGSIVKTGTECHIIGITKAIREEINKSFGDEIEITIEKDEEERTIKIPDDFKKEIEKDNEIIEFWNSLSFSIKKKYTNWIVLVKKKETRAKRIDSAIEKLKNKEKI